ncbi:zinc finger protein 414 [Brachionichthys hirsutus]|uniref:zinc finger protein 414 n=1 Tax=Brachionichthys hirsutus TaxID=412623 RepID=UPI003604FFAC
MMFTDNEVSQTAEDANRGKNRTPCPLYGCKRVYNDMAALESHIKDHEISAQSLPGKVLHCSTVGCNNSFPSMRELMEHMRHHHKPNIFFMCENCRNKLRSYRGLLTHLHTCSKMPRGKAKPAEPTPPPPADDANTNMTTPMAIDEKPAPQDSVAPNQEASFQIANPGGFFHAAVSQADSAVQSLHGSRFLAKQETSPPQLVPQKLAEAVPQTKLTHEASDLPLLRSLIGHTVPLDPLDAQGQHQTQARSSGSAPHCPPASGVWKKNQGIACSRRILWQHTKGRYMCVQCGHIVTNRKEMTQHINLKHGGNRPAEGSGSFAANS